MAPGSSDRGATRAQTLSIVNLIYLQTLIYYICRTGETPGTPGRIAPSQFDEKPQKVNAKAQ
jgi:hypothetical protein